MENEQNSQGQETQTAPSFPQENQNVSFPSSGSPKKSGGAKTLLIIGILVLVAILGFVIYKSATKKNDVVSTEPTAFDNLTQPVSDQSQATPVPTSTPAAVDKTKVAIQIQNGTGIAGEAAYLQTQLGGLGYTDIKVGNATTQNASATSVTFSSSLDSSVVTEITQKLKTLYQSVTVSNSGSTTFDIVIVTGLRKGATPKPSATPSSTSSPTPTPTPTPTAH